MPIPYRRRVLTPESVYLWIAIFTVVVPVVLVVVVAIAAVRRSRGTPVGPRTSALVSGLVGLNLGAFILVGGSELSITAPILVAAALFVILQLRRRHWTTAGLILAGTALPWATLWAIYLGALVLQLNDFDTGSVVQGLLVGAVPLGVGLALVARGDPPPPAPEATAPAGEPGSRAFGTITAAIRAPSVIGPLGISEIAALVAFIAPTAILPFFIPADVPRLVMLAIPLLVGSVLATEAYIRAMPTPTRKAFEAFSWLGEWELHRYRLSPFRVPTKPAAAEKWLATHPETPETLGLRAELLSLARRFDEARAIAERMPSSTPQERWDRTETLDSVDWRAGGDGDPTGLATAAAELLPIDGDEHLRAEVSLATAEVRKRMADGRSTPGNAAEPLIEVRERLGNRADGQVGRALRKRLLLTFLAVGAAFAGTIEILGLVGATPP
jgi:hypothetical protein